MAALAGPKRLSVFAAVAAVLSVLAQAGAAAAEAFDTAAIEASVVRVIAPLATPDQYSMGTGWIVHGRRIVVTNNHVVEGGVAFQPAMLVDGNPKLLEAKLLKR